MEIFYSIIPIMVYLLFTTFSSVKMKTYQGVYLLLGGVWIYLHYAGVLDGTWWIPIVILVVGEIVHILLAGTIGTKMGVNTYAALLGAVGLFPYHNSFAYGFIYFFLSLVVVGIFSWLKYYSACKKFGLPRGTRPDAAKKKLSTSDYTDFVKAGSLRVGLPLFVSVVLSTLLIFVI